MRLGERGRHDLAVLALWRNGVIKGNHIKVSSDRKSIEGDDDLQE